ncbi:hypothetical protein B7C62_19815 [Kitasatospora albolonga]|uniref:Secreted protein n=1 Tax=Kitasatospora albolonga TaxID=68173 RepID=A0ABC8BWH0_9ACTN|nr:hypothetical protein B7C62_19815 [Kitasatospora albolonga]
MEATERCAVAADGVRGAEGAVRDAVREAEDAVARLKEGLAGVGVTLPSLRVDPVSCAGNEPTPLVDLGRCNIDTALRLCEVLAEKGSGHGG